MSNLREIIKEIERQEELKIERIKKIEYRNRKTKRAKESKKNSKILWKELKEKN